MSLENAMRKFHWKMLFEDRVGNPLQNHIGKSHWNITLEIGNWKCHRKIPLENAIQKCHFKVPRETPTFKTKLENDIEKSPWKIPFENDIEKCHGKIPLVVGMTLVTKKVPFYFFRESNFSGHSLPFFPRTMTGLFLPFFFGVRFHFFEGGWAFGHLPRKFAPPAGNSEYRNRGNSALGRCLRGLLAVLWKGKSF